MSSSQEEEESPDDGEYSPCNKSTKSPSSQPRLSFNVMRDLRRIQPLLKGISLPGLTNLTSLANSPADTISKLIQFYDDRNKRSNEEAVAMEDQVAVKVARTKKSGGIRQSGWFSKLSRGFRSSR